MQINYQKYKDKSTKWLRSKADEHFNRWVRLSKSSSAGTANCMACNKIIMDGTGYFHAGHYFDKGSFPSLRYYEDNVWPQCKGCNDPKNNQERVKALYTVSLTRILPKDRFDKLMDLSIKDKMNRGPDRLKYIYVIELYSMRNKELIKTKNK